LMGGDWVRQEAFHLTASSSVEPTSTTTVCFARSSSVTGPATACTCRGWILMGEVTHGPFPSRVFRMGRSQARFYLDGRVELLQLGQARGRAVRPDVRLRGGQRCVSTQETLLSKTGPGPSHGGSWSMPGSRHAATVSGICGRWGGWARGVCRLRGTGRLPRGCCARGKGETAACLCPCAAKMTCRVCGTKSCGTGETHLREEIVGRHVPERGRLRVLDCQRAHAAQQHVLRDLTPESVHPRDQDRRGGDRAHDVLAQRRDRAGVQVPVQGGVDVHC